MEKKPLTPADVQAMQEKLAKLESENLALKSNAPTEVKADAALADKLIEIEKENKILREQAIHHADELQAAQDTLIASQSAFLLGSNVSEVSLGENDEGEELWRYKVDLPPSGGMCIKLNGLDYFHGEQYNFTTDQLRSIKDIVARCWNHEASIMGSNENFYRQPTSTTLRGNSSRRH